jgi:hypothetical protein
MLENFVEELQIGVFVGPLGYELWGLQNCLTQNCLNLERNLDSLTFDHFNIILMGRSIIYYNKVILLIKIQFMRKLFMWISNEFVIWFCLQFHLTLFLFILCSYGEQKNSMKNINSWSCHLEGLIPYFNNLIVKENVSSFEFHWYKITINHNILCWP